MRISNTSGGILFVTAVALGLTGCTGGTTSSDPTVTRTVTASPTSSPTTAPATDAATDPAAVPTPTPTCGPTDGTAVASRAIADLPLPSGLQDSRWDPATADLAGYDPCAALSWATVTLERATGSSPVAILLFHQGRYLGTATKEQYAFTPDVSRTDPSTIAVTYHYAKPDEPLAEASGRAEAAFTWSDSAGRVQMQGDTPPAG